MMSTSYGRFKLSEYDVIALDFDNTIVQYNLDNLFRLHYNYLSRYLVEKKGYKGLATTMDSSDIDFIMRGLFMDFNRGNILKISANGTILQASHGTKKLSAEEIVQVYGTTRSWYPLKKFIQDKVISSSSKETFSFFDYIDCVAIVVYAKTIDLLDRNNSTDYRSAWIDLLEAIKDMHSFDSEFLLIVGKSISDYIYKCDSTIVDWLKKLKETHKLILITKAVKERLHMMANYCLGSDWKDLFHTIIESADKPYFFIDQRPFKDLNNEQIVLNTSQGHYKHGNWQEMYKVLSEEFSRSVRCVYLGDNLLHDVYAPSAGASPSLDTVSIIEEALTEGYFPGNQHPHADFIRSQFWGPLFVEDCVPTVIGDIMMNYSKLCIPLLQYLAEKPLDWQHKPFWTEFPYNENVTNLQQLKAASY